MVNVCWQCGLYRVDKIIDPSGPVAICPECGYRHPFLQLPLLVISGASGAGKSTVCQALLGQIPEVVLLDADILWRPEFNTPTDQYLTFCETWLRLCKNIGQAGRPVVLFGAGIGVPGRLERCVERRYLGLLHFLALICDPDVLAQRLYQRPAWRASGEPTFVEAQIQFNNWFRNQAQSGDMQVDVFDTTRAPLKQTLVFVAAWIRNRVASL